MSHDKHEKRDQSPTSLDEDDIENPRDTSDTAERKGAPPTPLDGSAGLMDESQYLIIQPLDMGTGLIFGDRLISFDDLEPIIKKIKYIIGNIQWADRLNSPLELFKKLKTLILAVGLLIIWAALLFPEVAQALSLLPPSTIPAIAGIYIVLRSSPIPSLLSDYFARAADQTCLEIGVRDTQISTLVRHTRWDVFNVPKQSLQMAINLLQSHVDKLQKIKEIKTLLQEILLSRPLGGNREASAVTNVILDRFLYGQEDFTRSARGETLPMLKECFLGRPLAGEPEVSAIANLILDYAQQNFMTRPASEQTTPIGNDAARRPSLNTLRLLETTARNIEIQPSVEEVAIEINDISHPSSFHSRRASLSTGSTIQTQQVPLIEPSTTSSQAAGSTRALSDSGMSTFFSRQAVTHLPQPPTAVSTIPSGAAGLGGDETNNADEIESPHFKRE
jgi:hypothetical protein